ncbi:MmcQ/YjbR family DNA-binding protein [Actinomycetospora sp. TBRC 11914]|uniref:MmcQ/YjbR family DNA-binding protein n=1 Tax=Actinomycetospora sp. TBRC 11914 TaxID=2729387 RepID=UPI00145D08E8|nr:MmcQ/YjbR family DNA-binding protein [Actinomycetospora sp. TBRC 11914]NMO91368.1 MmcQ/YjbR family DNA-binding protein [Actinomycetospora sp. TBRC 11914]
MPDAEQILAAVRAACLALPEVVERPSHGSPAWFVRGKKTFVVFADHHHGDPHTAIWAAAPPGVAAELVAAEPARFFVPPYVGHRGWLGLRLDLAGEDALDGTELRGIAVDAWRTVAPTTLLRLLDA